MHARRIWSVKEAVSSWWKVPTGTGSAGSDRTNGIRQVLRRVATKDRVHGTAQLKLDPPADWKPVQLQKSWNNMLLRPEFEHQATSERLRSALAAVVRSLSATGRPVLSCSSQSET